MRFSGALFIPVVSSLYFLLLNICLPNWSIVFCASTFCSAVIFGSLLSKISLALSKSRVLAVPSLIMPSISMYPPCLAILSGELAFLK